MRTARQSPADLLDSKGFKIAGAMGAQVYESDGGTLMKYAPEKPAAATGEVNSFRRDKLPSWGSIRAQPLPVRIARQRKAATC